MSDESTTNFWDKIFADPETQRKPPALLGSPRLSFDQIILLWSENTFLGLDEFPWGSESVPSVVQR